MVTRVTIGHDGDMTENELPTTGGVVSSNDYVGGGVKVKDGFGSRTVHDQSDLKGHELVTVDGMEIKATMAKELGLLDKLFAPSKMNRAADAAQAPLEAAPVETHEPGSYEEADAAINLALEEGKLDATEASETSTALGQAALTGWTPAQAQEVIEGLRTGTVDAMDLSNDQQQVAAAVETKVTNAQTVSAKAELGSEAFNHLQQIAASNPDVDAAIRGYGIQRAQGRADASWGDLYSDVLEHVNGQ